MSDLGEKLEKEIRRLAAEKPDFTYNPPDGNACVYIHNGEGSCIVGQALVNLGIVGTDLEHDTTKLEINGIDTYEPNSVQASQLFRYLKLKVEAAEAAWIDDVQSEQDSGTAWAKATAEADRLKED